MAEKNLYACPVCYRGYTSKAAFDVNCKCEDCEVPLELVPDYSDPETILPSEY